MEIIGTTLFLSLKSSASLTGLRTCHQAYLGWPWRVTDIKLWYRSKETRNSNFLSTSFGSYFISTYFFGAVRLDLTIFIQSLCGKKLGSSWSSCLSVSASYVTVCSSLKKWYASLVQETVSTRFVNSWTTAKLWEFSNVCHTGQWLTRLGVVVCIKLPWEKWPISARASNALCSTTVRKRLVRIHDNMLEVDKPFEDNLTKLLIYTHMEIDSPQFVLDEMLLLPLLDGSLLKIIPFHFDFNRNIFSRQTHHAIYWCLTATFSQIYTSFWHLGDSLLCI